MRRMLHLDKSTRHRIAMHRQIYLMYLPAVLTVIAFNLFTTYGLKIAWLDFNFQDGLNSPYIGWEYFRVLFRTPRFFRLMRNTVEITFFPGCSSGSPSSSSWRCCSTTCATRR